MAKRRASAEDVVAHYGSLPQSAGSAEERLAATAKYFKIQPATVRQYLRFWWPGRKYMQEFGEDKRRRPRWDRSTEELLDAMNRYGNVAQAARALKTTSVTLTRALKRHGIVQKWVAE
jgi:transcriptional regulator with GAF, ATPase, and Fis domain